MTKDVDEKLKVVVANDIKVETDVHNEQYTNESLFEFLINRSSDVKPANIQTVASMRGFVSGGCPGGNGGTLEIGAWASGPVPLNISEAIKAVKQYIQSGIVNRNSKHQCARYVRLYLEAGFGGGVIGAKALGGHPVAAHAYSKFLPSIGFKKIAELNGVKAQSDFSQSAVKPGDVAVMSHGQYGHICIWDGGQWVSDFVQRNMWPYGGNGLVYIFRYANA